MRARIAVVGTATVIVVVAGLLAFRTSGGTAALNSNPTSFDLAALTGSGRVRLADFRGRPVVVNLFASWCAECAVELPGFARAANDLRGRVQFVGVNSMETGDGRGMADRYHLQASGFALARDSQDRLHAALRAPGMPVTVFYDGAGTLLVRDVASLSERDLRAELHALYGV